ncbi:unnamed protein product, partial [Prorocentrum cordatum]
SSSSSSSFPSSPPDPPPDPRLLPPRSHPSGEGSDVLLVIGAEHVAEVEEILAAGGPGDGAQELLGAAGGEDAAAGDESDWRVELEKRALVAAFLNSTRTFPPEVVLLPREQLLPEYAEQVAKIYPRYREMFMGRLSSARTRVSSKSHVNKGESHRLQELDRVKAEADKGEAITVGVRLRPLLPHEKGQKPILKIIGDKVVSVVEGAGVKYTGPSSFQFDYAMDSTDASSPSYVGAAKCYDLMGRRMLEHMMLGYSTCLFCYGQTGTGKTTTIMGKPSPVEEQGILLRLITELFAEVARLQAEGYEATVQLQMLEVYNEKISDLLVPRNKSNSPGGDNKKVDVHVHPDIGVYLTGATELTVEKADKCAQWIEFGNSMKTVHATAMNSQSSRGHTVVKINVERKGGPDGTVLRSEVYFADLAGRENEKTTQVQGDRLIELTFINRSLLQLANCIQTLGKAGMAARRKTTMKPQAPSPPDGAPEDSPPPPSKKGKDMSKFRNSKLTLLLSNALSGNSRTAMIGTLSPAIGNFEESYSTLRFAVTVGAIKVEATKTTEQDYPALVKKLQGEVAELRSQLSEAKANVFTDHGIKLVETEVRAREELVDRLTKDPKVARRESKTHEHLMQDVMRQYGIKEFSEVPFPRLVNCSDDSGEIGKMLYHIPDDDVEHPLGSDDSNDFRLPPRTGVLPRMCTLRNDGQHVWIRLARPAEDKEHPKAADVRIDGVPLGPEEARVGHLSCLHFGPATAFYVCTEQVSKEELFRRWSEPPTNASAEELMSLILGDGRDEQREQIGQAAKRPWRCARAPGRFDSPLAFAPGGAACPSGPMADSVASGPLRERLLADGPAEVGVIVESREWGSATSSSQASEDPLRSRQERYARLNKELEGGLQEEVPDSGSRVLITWLMTPSVIRCFSYFFIFVSQYFHLACLVVMARSGNWVAMACLLPSHMLVVGIEVYCARQDRDLVQLRRKLKTGYCRRGCRVAVFEAAVLIFGGLFFGYPLVRTIRCLTKERDKSFIDEIEQSAAGFDAGAPGMRFDTHAMLVSEVPRVVVAHKPPISAYWDRRCSASVPPWR